MKLIIKVYDKNIWDINDIFYKCISIKVAKQILNWILSFRS